MNLRKFLTTTFALIFALTLLVGAVQAQDLARYHLSLDSTRCGNTEDTTGADEYYVGAVFVAVKPDGTQESFTRISDPFDINDGQTSNNPQILFDEMLPRGTRVYGRLRFYDEDVARDWNQVRGDFNNAASSLLKGSSVGGPKAQAAAAVAYGAFKIIDGVSASDKDDLLGTVDVTMGDPSLDQGGTKRFSVDAGKVSVGNAKYTAAANQAAGRNKNFVSYYSGEISFSKRGNPITNWDYTQSWFSFIEDKNAGGTASTTPAASSRGSNQPTRASNTDE